MYLGTLFPIVYILIFLMSFDNFFTKIFLLNQLHGGFFVFAFYLVNISHIFISLI